MQYHVWDRNMQYLRDIDIEDHLAGDISTVLQVAKQQCNTPAPAVQSVSSFIDQYMIKSYEEHQRLLMSQYLKFAEIKTTEQRSWRDRRY